MEPKNVMLLGFINKAVEYLEKHMDEQSDAKLAQLKNLDLNALESELKGNLDSSLGTMNSTIETLLQAGEDSFDKFIDIPQKKRISNEIDKMFDVNLDTDEPLDQKASLEDLLSFYNLSDDMLLDEENLDHRFSSIREKPISRNPVIMDEEQLERNFENFVGHTPKKGNKLDVLETQNDFERFVVTDPSKRSKKKFDEYVYIRDDDSMPDFASSRKNAADLLKDGIYNNPGTEPVDVKPVRKEIRKEPEEPVFMMSKEDSRLLDMIARNVEKNQENSSLESRFASETQEKNTELDNVFSEVVSNESEYDGPNLDDIVDSETVENLIDYATDDDLVSPADNNDIIKLLQDMDVANQKNYYNDQPFDSNNNVYNEDLISPEHTYQSLQQQPGFVNTLIDDLRNKMIQEDERRQAIEEEYAQVFDRIHKTYPYLSSGFVRSVYELKDSIANEYPFNVKIIVLHRVIFKEVEYLRQFVEIALNHDFSINADEDKMIVDVFKEYINTDGKIITSIFDVSNQAALLGGEYDGYRVLFTQKV